VLLAGRDAQAPEAGLARALVQVQEVVHLDLARRDQDHGLLLRSRPDPGDQEALVQDPLRAEAGLQQESRAGRTTSRPSRPR
jgi:hypothetical protein